jgi:hypothetical protein
MHDADFLDTVNSPNDFFEKSEDTDSSPRSNSNSYLDTPIRMHDGTDFVSYLNHEKPKLNFEGAGLGGTGKFKRNKVNRIESELKVTGQHRTEIDRKMLLEMKEYNHKKLT